MRQRTTKSTIRLKWSAKTLISLRIREVWSESSLIACAFYSFQAIPSRKHVYIILSPLNPTFYFIKLGFTRVYIIFLISAHITKTCLYNFDPLEPHFYIEKLRFTGVYNIFLIFAQNIDCRYSFEPPHRGGSNEYHNLCFEKKYKEKYQIFV